MNILIGGAAGQGMETIAQLLGKALVRTGYGVLSAKDYMSRVRGGHNFTRLRIGRKTPWTADGPINLLVALNEEAYQIHSADLADNGRIIFDPEEFTPENKNDNQVAVQLEKLAKDAGNKIMANTVAVGATLALLGLQTTETEELLTETFGKELAGKNILALKAGHQEAGKQCETCLTLPDKQERGKQLFLDGNSTLGMAALASGCRFLSAYPMTPSTGIMTYLAGKQDSHDVVVEQAEDEIAAINMALGASFTGARAMTCTSGGGFALMVEGLSLAGMTETPLVIALAMRPGPATGLPTRTEQGDLEFALHGGHGEFPRAILSATHAEDAFYRLNKAFDLAEKYQTPVIFLSDQDFGDTARSIPPFDFSKLCYRRHLVSEDNLKKPYQRYRITENGISPRALPGQFAGETVLADSDEHDENGNIIEDAETRTRMVRKRMKKTALLAAEMDEPKITGEKSGDILLIGWGSTYGALQEARQLLSKTGQQVTHLHFADLWPLRCAQIKSLFPRFKQRICVENNATGQFAALLRRETGLKVDREILKFNGRPFMASEIVREVQKDV
ncbi:2-oxoacid:acceptor oxidoreductase subunit alpha [Dethiobacter alkaliphilus]|uniref:Pyruvate flavodoxin/ferredoxin oxidoreductase domain protein n=1 Tax=Dethiobacter alkaliphilus AHT 1 TaxID=555088 RepID=C0GF90_DETAL|nr:2-oxoacid:acceptor oxidoreductase subunit alpha [Dethiobacter alkaliphilus]EEG77850.1 pyruvate flavodoxin/ferredoxin oxidoreductase domain protein [Dethiobacter alkaliphilus AHT 1]